MDYTQVIKYSVLIVVIFLAVHMGLMQISPDWSMGHAGIITGVAVAALAGQLIQASQAV